MATGRAVRMYERGSTLPINAGASALVLLAWSPSDEARRILETTELRRFTPATLTDVDAITERLTHIRDDGYSIIRAELGPDVVGDEPVQVRGDASRLAQVLANLLANARTHTPAGTAVAVVVSTEPGAARVSVVDQGPGIAPDLLPHVFERFARGSTSRSRHTGSTGLGLAIVHAVVAAHHGTVTVTSQPGRTEFAVRLPWLPSLTARAWQVSGRSP